MSSLAVLDVKIYSSLYKFAKLNQTYEYSFNIYIYIYLFYSYFKSSDIFAAFHLKF